MISQNNLKHGYVPIVYHTDIKFSSKDLDIYSCLKVYTGTWIVG